MSHAKHRLKYREVHSLYARRWRAKRIVENYEYIRDSTFDSQPVPDNHILHVVERLLNHVTSPVLHKDSMVISVAACHQRSACYLSLTLVLIISCSQMTLLSPHWCSILDEEKRRHTVKGLILQTLSLHFAGYPMQTSTVRSGDHWYSSRDL